MERNPYIDDLAARAQQNRNRTINLKLRTLLKTFGFYRRTEGIVADVLNQLKIGGFEADFSMAVPASLDDRIILRLTSAPPPKNEKLQNSTSGIFPLVEGDITVLAEKAVNATVVILTDTGQGSGFIVHPDGLVVTASHVVEGEDGFAERKVRVHLSDRKEVEGTVFRAHPNLDYALLWLHEKGPYPTLPLGNPKALRYSQTVLAVGAPSGLSHTVSKGIVSNPTQVFRGVECIQTDTSIDHGNSGGPLVCTDGAVGIVVWGLGDVASAKFAIPVDYFKDEIDLAIRQGKDKCNKAGMCPVCGYTDFDKLTWYCQNCGSQFAGRKNKSRKEN